MLIKYIETFTHYVPEKILITAPSYVGILKRLKKKKKILQQRCRHCNPQGGAFSNLNSKANPHQCVLKR